MRVEMMRVLAIPMLAILMCASCRADHRRSETGVARDSAGVSTEGIYVSGEVQIVASPYAFARALAYLPPRGH